MKKTLCVLLALLLCAFTFAQADEGTAYTNEKSGFSLTLPQGFVRVNDVTKRSMLENMRADPENDYMYDMDVWLYEPDEARTILFTVQVKEPTYASFEEECALSYDELKAIMEKDIASSYGESFLRLDLFDAGTPRSTQAGDMLIRSYCTVLKDGSAVYNVYADLYMPSVEYCFCVECATREGDLAAMDMLSILNKILPTLRVETVTLEREEASRPSVVPGGWQEPVLNDPQSLYAPYDGSRDDLMDRMAENNASIKDVEEGCTLSLTARGYPYGFNHFLLEDTPYGRVLVVDYGDGDADYLFEDATWHIQDGRLSRTSASSDRGFLCGLCCFPFMELEKVLGVREDGNGYTYVLARSDDETLMEYVSDGSYRLVSTRIYGINESGGFSFTWELICEKLDYVPLPEKLSNLLESFRG